MISVIIPTYNREKTIERSARSVLDQTYQDLELIIVDDCSTDDTREIVRDLTKHDNRVRYICHKMNQGACAARNTGIDAAKGEYIAFQDSDDVWRPEKLEKQMEILKKYDADICYCKMRRYSDKGKVWEYPDLPEGIVDYETFISKAHASTQMIFAKREVCLEHRFDPEIQRFQDLDWSIRAGGNNKIVFLNEVMVDVYFQENSISNIGMQKSADACEVILKKYSDVCHDYPEFHIKLLNSIGKFRILSGDNSGEAYKKAYEITKNQKYIVKWLTCRVGLLKFYYWKKK